MIHSEHINRRLNGEHIIVLILRRFGKLNFTYLGNLRRQSTTYFGTKVDEKPTSAPFGAEVTTTLNWDVFKVNP